MSTGLYVCNGTTNDECIPPHPSAKLTTTFSVYNRRSAVIASRTNFSILSVTQNGPVTQNADVDLKAYRMALSWLLNYTDADIPAPSSLAEYFWSAPKQLTSDYWSTEPRQAMHGLLTFPLWWFQDNNYGNLAVARANVTDTSILPLEYHTTASIAEPYTRIVVNETMFILFVILEVCSCPDPARNMS